MCSIFDSCPSELEPRSLRDILVCPGPNALYSSLITVYSYEFAVQLPFDWALIVRTDGKTSMQARAVKWVRRLIRHLDVFYHNTYHVY